MESLSATIKRAERGGYAIGHFNISDSVALGAIFNAAREAGVPVLIGTSEGEREFLGIAQGISLVQGLRKTYGFPIFSNADHTHSLDKVKEAAAAGYDSIIFDGSKMTWEENVRQTKEAVDYVKSVSKNILVEGEIGYIGSSSQILKELPKGAAIRSEDLTTPEQAKEFVRKTGVDLLAPAVGNIHGMFAGAPNPRLDIERIYAIKKAVNVPIVLHGGSGIRDDDFRAAIKAGVSVIHINTELRIAWRRGLEAGLSEDKNEVAPYKILAKSAQAVQGVVRERLRLFSGTVAKK